MGRVRERGKVAEEEIGERGEGEGEEDEKGGRVKKKRGRGRGRMSWRSGWEEKRVKTGKENENAGREGEAE